MSHHASTRFWRLFSALPEEVQRLARENYRLLRDNPQHPSLHFKRALGVESPDGIVWFWIGSHDEYDQIIRRK